MLAELAVRPCPRINLSGRSPASARGRVRSSDPPERYRNYSRLVHFREGDEARDERRREGDRYAAVKGGFD